MHLRCPSDPIAKALWYIESHLRDDISLEMLEAACGSSRYHMSRAFTTAIGRPIMAYVRGRGLSEAARALCSGAPDIVSVAFDAQYGSHEAFTRAFRDYFGVTPEALRARGHLANITLLEPRRKDRTVQIKLDRPRIETGRRLLIAGLTERDCDRIPFLWQRFAPYLGNIAGQRGRVGYGVRANSDDEGRFEYIAGVEVATFEGIAQELTLLRIRQRRYAVFDHHDHVSTIRATYEAIWDTWLAQSDNRIADAPDFERYGDGFDPHSGTGDIEIWIPIE